MFWKILATILLCDQLAVSIVERLCHKIQRFFGITCFAIARNLIFAKAVLYYVVDYEYAKLSSWWVTTTLVCALIVAIEFYWLRCAEKGIRIKDQATTMNPNRANLGMSFARIWFLVITFSSLMNLSSKDVKASHVLVHFLGYLFYAVVCCTPLPPGQSKIRQWFKSLVPLRLRPAAIPAGS